MRKCCARMFSCRELGFVCGLSAGSFAGSSGGFVGGLLCTTCTNMFANGKWAMAGRRVVRSAGRGGWGRAVLGGSAFGGGVRDGKGSGSSRSSPLGGTHALTHACVRACLRRPYWEGLARPLPNIFWRVKPAQPRVYPFNLKPSKPADS